ncbi:hypothetical protein VTL71DRAFT_4339 [Oculimacula yallundae]|uniref:Enoyl reductase (ER) domain-containing protein n=1 Tax=Oculimacula yallundae TaxID=86028 RepID=A0ABR4C1S4_9HELO
MSIPLSFKAAVIPTARAQNVVTTRSLALLSPDEIGIRITATAINPVDWKMRDHEALLPSYPAVIGSDAAGIIVSLGSSIKNFAIGDRVFFQGIIGDYDSSTFQEYCKMPAALVGKTPHSVSDEQVAGVSLAIVAAVTAFYDKSGHGMTPPWDVGGDKVGNGKAVVILGGASSVGQYAIQMAKLSGFERVVTNASINNHELLRSLGADVVLDRAKSSPEDFKAALGNYPLDFVFDSISSSQTQVLGVQVLQVTNTVHGHLVVLYIVDPETPNPDAIALGTQNQPKVEVKQVLGIGSAPHLRYLSEPLFMYLGGDNGYIATGILKANRPKIVTGGLEAVEEALELNKKGVSAEKVVLVLK